MNAVDPIDANISRRYWGELQYGKALLRCAVFLLSIVLLSVAFCVLWASQYDTSNRILAGFNHALAPWGWLAAYFMVCLVNLRGVFRLKRLLIASLTISLVLTGIVYWIVAFVLVPIFDPWF